MAPETSSTRTSDVELLARWLGTSDVVNVTLLELADEMERMGRELEAGAELALDRLLTVASIAGFDHLLAGGEPEGPAQERMAPAVHDLMVGMQQADRMRQVLHHAADVLLALVALSSEHAASTLGERPGLQSTAEGEAERLRNSHTAIGLGTLRRKLMASIGLRESAPLDETVS